MISQNNFAQRGGSSRSPPTHASKLGHMKGTLTLCLFFAFLVLQLGVGSAVQIDSIKTFDSIIPKTLSNICSNLSVYTYGALSSSCTQGTTDKENRILYGLAYRYNHNFTTQLGYNDTNYLNQTILNASLNMGDYLVRVQNTSAGGFNTWLGTYAENGFLCQSMGLAYLELNSSGLLNSSQNVSWYNAIVNASGYLTNPAVGDKYFVANQLLNKIACLAIEQNITGDNRYFLNGTNSKSGIRNYLENYRNYISDGVPVEWNEPIQSSTSETLKVLGYDSNYNPFSLETLAIIHRFSPNSSREQKVDNFDSYSSQADLVSNNWSSQASGSVNFSLNTNASFAHSGSNSINITTKGGAAAFIATTKSNMTLRNYDLITFWAYKITNSGTADNRLRLILRNDTSLFYDVTNTTFVDDVWTKFYIYPNGNTVQNISFLIDRSFNTTVFIDDISISTLKYEIEQDINISINSTQYFLFLGNESNEIQCGFSNRASRCYTFQTYNGSHYTGDVNPDLIVASMYFSNLFAPFARFAKLVNTRWTETDWSGHSSDYIGHTANEFIYLYDMWNTSNVEPNYLLPNENSSDHVFISNVSGLVSIKLSDYLVQLSSNLTTPFGVISDILNLNSKSHIVSGSDRDTSFNNARLTGIGVLGDNNFSNTLDSNNTRTVLSLVYPYKIQFTGNLSNVSQNKSNTSYYTIYTFYNESVDIYQNTTSNVELQIWTVNISNLDGLSVGQGNWFLTNKWAIKANNFNLSLSDTSNSVGWGVIDKLNASGTAFNYSMQFECTNNTLCFTSLNNALFYNTNGTVYGSTTISANDGNINITLQARNSSYVLDNFNLTEGVTRQNSPLNLTLTSSNENSRNYHIKSNLNGTVQVPIIVNVANCNIDVVLLPNGGFAYEPAFTCDRSTLKVTIPQANLTFSTTSNELSILYTFGVAQDSICENFGLGVAGMGSGVATAVGMIGVLLVMIILGAAYAYYKGDVNVEVDSNIAFFLVLGIGGFIIFTIITVIVVDLMCTSI